MEDRKSVNVRASPIQCPYCHGALEDVREVVACAACGARHHAPCRTEHGRCATCGSAALLVPEGAAPPRRTPVPAVSVPLDGKIVARQEGDVVSLAWPRARTLPLAPALLALLSIVPAIVAAGVHDTPSPFLVPVLLWLWVLGLRRKGRKPGQELNQVELGPDHLEVPVARFEPFGPTTAASRRRLSRANVTAVHVTLGRGTLALTVCTTTDTFVAASSSARFDSGLSAAEIAWLHRTLEDWLRR